MRTHPAMAARWMPLLAVHSSSAPGALALLVSCQACPGVLVFEGSNFKMPLPLLTQE